MTAVDDYVQHLRRTNYRHATVEQTRYCLQRVRRLVGVDLTEMTPEQADDWWVLHTAGPQGRRVDLSMLRCFYRWAKLHGLVEADPTVRLAMPRKPKGMPRPMADGELHLALDHAGREMTAVLLVAAFCGLRIGEISLIRWRDILDLQAPPSLAVPNGKGGRGRVVPLPQLALDALREMPNRGPWVFPRSDGRKPYTPARLSQKTNTHLRTAGVQATVHQLRHRYATEVYRQSRDLRLTQELCGHASPETTAQYTKYAAEDAAGVVQRVAEAWGKEED
jgi:integrase/recombinase XerC